MAQSVIRIEALPDAALDAAAQFHARHLGEVREMLDREPESLAVLLPAAPREHGGWRRATVQDLARSHAPVRVNFVAGGDEAAIRRTVDWLAAAPGVTGQLFLLD